MNKWFLTVGFILVAGLAAQEATAYRGDLSFDYSGTLSGSFSAATTDSLSLAGGLVLSGTDSGLVLITALEHVGHDTFNLLILYGLDTTGAVTPQTWTLNVSGETFPPQALLFIPNLDSTTALGLVEPLLDTTNASVSDSLLISVLEAFLQTAYGAISGAFTVASVDTDSLTGTFSATAIKVGFPPPTLLISNGQFHLAAVIDTQWVAVKPEPYRPEAFSLFDVYPNPFNPATRITFNITREAPVTVAVYNLLGEEKAVLYHGILPSGVHSFTYRAQDTPAGIYFIRLRAPQRVATRKILLIK